MKIHKNLKFFLFILLLVISMQKTFAIEDISIEPGTILSLNDCIKIALHNCHHIKDARINYKMSKANVNIARAEFFPTIVVGTGYDFNGVNTKRTTSGTGAYSVNTELNQLLWNFGRTNAHIKMQKFYLIADKYNFENEVRTTIFNVKKCYYEVLANRTTVAINDAFVNINERNYQRTKAYFEQGIKSKIDLVNAEVLLSDSKISLIQSENDYKNSIITLNQAMHLDNAPAYSILGTESFNKKNNTVELDLTNLKRNSETATKAIPISVNDAKLLSSVEKLEILSNYKIKDFPYSFEESIQKAYENRSDLKAYNAVLDAVKENLTVVKRNYYPSLSANAGYSFRDKNRTNSLNVGVNLSSSVNIMNQKANVDIAKLQVELAQNSLEHLNEEIFFEVQNAYVNMIELEKQIPLLAVKVRQTLENFELAEGRYYVGLGDYIQLQDAKVNYNNAQCTYVETIYKYNVAKANLESVIALPQEVTISIEDEE